MTFCVTCSKKPLSPIIGCALMETAQEMYWSRKRSAHIQTDGIEARVRSNFEYASMKNVVGIFFVADIRLDDRTTHVEFVVHDCNLASDYLPGEELKALDIPQN